jgi:Ca-activated chloride channel homolog
MTRTYRGLAAALTLTLFATSCQRAPEPSSAFPMGTPAPVMPAAPATPEAPLVESRALEVPASSGDGASALESSAAPGKGDQPPAEMPRDEAASALPPAPPSSSPSVARSKRSSAGRGRAAGQVQSIGGVSPGPELDTEAYAAVEETGFVDARTDPLSTFSIDVDTASYSNVRRFLNQGKLPPAGAVRIEELINYFPFAYAEPTGDAPFSVTTEVSVAPWNPAHRLLHVGLQGKRLQSGPSPARNLVFLLDVSGSMESPDKLPLLARSLATLAETLTERDHVAIVVYAGASGLVLPPTAGDQRAQILAALDRLSAGGSTNGADGIELAYAVAESMARPDSINRVILATDGDFNVGVTSQSELLALIEAKRQTGVFLSVLGFGMGNYKDSTLELLADKGNGNYAYIDSLAEARKVLVAESGGTLWTLAKDVKLQLEFNPAQVGAYRLIGYENRRLAARDFNDDGKDAGELGAGHSVTALYELVPPGVPIDTGSVDALRYQSPPRALGSPTTELCTLKLRYKEPRATQSRLLEQRVGDSVLPLLQTSPAFRFSAAVAIFGMTLRQSQARGASSFALARELADGALESDPHGYRREFLSLVETARGLRR